jgi:hypothetical protein
MSAEVWTRTLDMYLTRSGDSQVKPMKQVLTVLIKLLHRRTDTSAIASLVATTIQKCLLFIDTKVDVSCVKAAMIVLDLLLTKSIITSSEFLKVVTDSRSVDASEDVNGNDTSSTSPSMSSSESGEANSLARVAVGWLNEAEVAPAASRLLVSCLKDSVYKDVTNNLNSYFISLGRLPGWLSLVLDVISEQPEGFESLEHHFLAGLLRLIPSPIPLMIQSLPLKKLAEGDSPLEGWSSEILRLCLVVLRTAEELGIQIEVGALQFMVG